MPILRSLRNAHGHSLKIMTKTLHFDRSQPYLKRSAVERSLMCIIVFAPLIAVAYALVHYWHHPVTWKEPAMMIGFYILTGLGITIGFHRMVTHRSFQANPIVRAFFMILGVMAFEGSPISWAALHLMHHKHSDKEKDPHSPNEGFWHAHVGWLFGDFKDDRWNYGKWLEEDKVVMFVHKTVPVWMALSLLIPYWIDGWTGFIWGGPVRIFITHHITWSVNSASHVWGRQPFPTTDESRNNPVVAVLAFGEGWHNNHHAFMWSARHGLLRGQFDLSFMIIKGLGRLGELIHVPLIWNINVPTDDDIQRKMTGSAQPDLVEAAA